MYGQINEKILKWQSRKGINNHLMTEANWFRGKCTMGLMAKD